MPLPEMSNPAEGAAGVLNSLNNSLPSYTENLGDWQRLGDVAASVVVDLSHRRERWIARHCRVAPSVAHAIASVAFPEVTQ